MLNVPGKIYLERLYVFVEPKSHHRPQYVIPSDCFPFLLLDLVTSLARDKGNEFGHAFLYCFFGILQFERPRSILAPPTKRIHERRTLAIFAFGGKDLQEPKQGEQTPRPLHCSPSKRSSRTAPPPSQPAPPPASVPRCTMPSIIATRPQAALRHGTALYLFMILLMFAIGRYRSCSRTSSILLLTVQYPPPIC